ncbi:unnamed protein product [Adineta ricciae]|uniref:Hint domain-containing protein n=1 Tax=Adineta ricciae TaxID=249248 RepID=A0A814UVE4_ADIRI|nr:unnamed protein product [Adineta ricciae]
MRSNSYIPLIAALTAVLCIGIVVGTIAVALIPVYLQQKGDDIDVGTNTNSQVYALSYITNSKNPTSYSLENMNALSAQLNQALDLKELVTLTAKYVPPTSSNRKKRATTECTKGQNTTNGLFETEFRIDYSKVCRTQVCQQKLTDKVNSHITTLFPSIDLSVNLPNGTLISFSLSFCSLNPAVSTTTTQQTSTTYTTNQPSRTTSTTAASTTTTSTTTTSTTTTSTTTTSTSTTTTTTTTTTVPLCFNGIKDQDETDIDCGGATCTARCVLTKMCSQNSDCANTNCHKTSKTCQAFVVMKKKAPAAVKFDHLPRDHNYKWSSLNFFNFISAPSCDDGNQNNAETDVDCGGTQTPSCPRCDSNEGCTTNSDCNNNDCLPSNLCAICFSGDEMVVLANGSTKWLKDTQVGEFIWTMSSDGTQTYLTEVMMIANTQRNTTALFYTIETETNHKLSLSPDHFIRVKHFDYLPAEQLTLNHSLFVVMKDGSIHSSRIRTINQENKTGVYNLFTLDGTALVNYIAASTYINNGFGSHHMKHRIYTPMRIGYHLSKHFEFLHNIYKLYMNKHRLRSVLLKLDARLTDDDRQRFHFFMGNNVPRRIRDDKSLNGTLSLLESLFDRDIINERDFTFLIDAFEEIECFDAAKLLREHRAILQSLGSRHSVQSLVSIMPPIRDGLLSSVINDQDNENDGIVIFNQLFNTPLTNLQNNHNTTNVRIENEGAEVTLLNNREKSSSSSQFSLANLLSRHIYILLVICVLLVVLATLITLVIKKNNQISHFEQQTSQVKQQISQFEQRIAQYTQQISEFRQNTSNLDDEKQRTILKLGATFGGDGGGHFDDSETDNFTHSCYLSGLEAGGDDDSLVHVQFFYSSSKDGGRIIQGPIHGDKKFSKTSRKFTLNEGEAFLKVQVYFNHRKVIMGDKSTRDVLILTGIQFATTMGRLSPFFGKHSGHEFSENSTGFILSYVTGRSGILIDQLQFVWYRNPAV